MLRIFIPIQFIILISFGQTSLDFQNKQLIKKLYKFGITDISQLDELIYDEKSINGKFFVIKDDVSPIKYIYIGRVNSCRTGGCSSNQNQPNDGSSEYFDYFAFFDDSGILKYIRVYNYRATHGSEITSRGWLQQFHEYDGSKELIVGKDIDVISGATISANGITFDINKNTAILREHILNK